MTFFGVGIFFWNCTIGKNSPNVEYDKWADFSAIHTVCMAGLAISYILSTEFNLIKIKLFLTFKSQHDVFKNQFFCVNWIDIAWFKLYKIKVKGEMILKLWKSEN